MESMFRGQWKMVLFRGILLTILGIVSLLVPAIAFKTLVILFGAYMLVDGFYFAATSIKNRNLANRGLYIAIGIISIMAGILAFVNPFAAGLALIYIFAFWLLISGIITIAVAIRIRKEIKGEGWFIAAGVLLILFSMIIILNPVKGGFTLALLFGLNAFLAGTLLISLAVRLRNHERKEVGVEM